MRPNEQAARLARREVIGLAALGTATAVLATAPVNEAGPRLRPDGTGLKRIGVLVAAHDFNPESELGIMNRGQANLFASRMPIRFRREYLTDPAHADAAIALLTELRPGAILYPSTSTSYFLGLDGEKAFKARLEGRTKGIPVIFPAMALAEALAALGVRRVGLIHPPWFGQEQHDLGTAYFRGRGIDVVYAARLTPDRAFSEVQAEEVYRWAMANIPAGVEAVIQGGNGLRIIGAIEALEASLGRPVITANQAMFWSGLKASGAPTNVLGYGKLFATAG